MYVEAKRVRNSVFPLIYRLIQMGYHLRHVIVICVWLWISDCLEIVAKIKI